MLFRKIALACVLAAFCLGTAMHAQAPAGYLPVFQNNLLDSSGNRVSNATVCAQVSLGGQPASVQVGGSYVTTFTSTCAPVTNGQWSMFLPDMSSAAPKYACVNLQATDDLTGNAILAGYNCIQPRSVPPQNIGGAPFWCGNTGCDLGLLPPNYPASDAFVAPVGATGPPGTSGCIVGQTCSTNLTPQNVGGVVYAVGYGVRTDGTNSDTAMRAAVAAAAGGMLILPPGPIKINPPLVLDNMEVVGAGRNSTYFTPATANPGVDMIQTHGWLRLSRLGINGGWDGHTTGLAGNGLATLNMHSAAGSQDGYEVQLDDVAIGGVDQDCIRIVDGAYESLHNVKCGTAGEHGLYLKNGGINGWTNTSLNVDGQSAFSSLPNGYGVVIENGININFSGGVTTLENTKGILVTGGANRALNFSNIYEENTTTGQFLTMPGSGGIGLKLPINFGVAGLNCSDFTAWIGFETNGTQISNCGNSAPVESVKSTNFSDAVIRMAGNFQFNANALGTYTPMTTLAVSSGAPWNATLIGEWVTGTGGSSAPPVVMLSSANPSIGIRGCTFTAGLSSAGIFQMALTAGNCGPTAFDGVVYLSTDRNAGSSSGVAMQTSDALVVGPVFTPSLNTNSGAAVSGACTPNGYKPVTIDGVVYHLATCP